MNKSIDVVADLGAERSLDYVRTRTDKYFTKSRQVVEKFGDKTVTYGIFMRRRIICDTWSLARAICSGSP